MCLFTAAAVKIQISPLACFTAFCTQVGLYLFKVNIWVTVWQGHRMGAGRVKRWGWRTAQDSGGRVREWVGVTRGSCGELGRLGWGPGDGAFGRARGCRGTGGSSRTSHCAGPSRGSHTLCGTLRPSWRILGQSPGLLKLKIVRIFNRPGVAEDVLFTALSLSERVSLFLQIFLIS